MNGNFNLFVTPALINAESKNIDQSCSISVQHLVVGSICYHVANVIPEVTTSKSPKNEAEHMRPCLDTIIINVTRM